MELVKLQRFSEHFYRYKEQICLRKLEFEAYIKSSRLKLILIVLVKHNSHFTRN